MRRIMEKVMVKSEHLINTAQLLIAIVSTVVILIFTAFSTFPTKESLATEFLLRSKLRDNQMEVLNSKLDDIKNSLERIERTRR